MFKFFVVALIGSVYGYDAPVSLPGSCPNGCGLAAGKVALAGEPLGPALAAPLFRSGLTLNDGYGGARVAVPVGPVAAAIQSHRSYEVIPVDLPYDAPVPQVIEVEPYYQPVNIVWRTQSSPLNLQQVHTPAAPQHESTRSEDQPSIVTHESYKPIIQEYREVIQPHRKIEQRILPVIEHVHTVVAKGEDYHQRGPIAKELALDGPVVAANGGYKKAA